jgi:hypothetical protein
MKLKLKRPAPKPDANVSIKPKPGGIHKRFVVKAKTTATITYSVERMGSEPYHYTQNFWEVNFPKLMAQLAKEHPKVHEGVLHASWDRKCAAVIWMLMQR